jgi:hypothetical protein
MALVLALGLALDPLRQTLESQDLLHRITLLLLQRPQGG